MFGIGWGEMVVIGLVALLVVGPEKLPEVARTVGKFYGQLRQTLTEAGDGLSKEVDELRLKKIVEADEPVEKINDGKSDKEPA